MNELAQESVQTDANVALPTRQERSMFDYVHGVERDVRRGQPCWAA